MTLAETILAIQNSTIEVWQKKEARNMLENSIEECIDIVKDPETELHSRREFQANLTLYRKLLNRL